MTNPDPTNLDRLHDIVAPPPAPWWPPAPAWYWVLGFLALATLVFAFRAFLRWQRNRYRREALAELARHEAALAVPAQRVTALAALAELLKRAALSAWPREEVAALNGAAWLAFLDRTGGTADNRFRSDLGAVLEDVAYDPRKATLLDENTLRELTALVRHWLKRHRVTIVNAGTSSPKTTDAAGVIAAFSNR